LDLLLENLLSFIPSVNLSHLFYDYSVEPSHAREESGEYVSELAAVEGILRVW
jgi:hypothetical protein